MTEKPIVLIGCPAQNRQDCIADYLKHIYELAYPKDRIILSFFVNNSTDRTGEIIQDFLNVHKDEYKAVKYHEGKVLKGRQDNQTRLTRRDYNLFAVVRNTFLRKIKPFDFDYFFSVDSDVLLNPDDLNQLLSHKKDVVSAVLFNGVKDNIDYYNIFKMTNQTNLCIGLNDAINQIFNLLHPLLIIINVNNMYKTNPFLILFREVGKNHLLTFYR